MLSSSTNVECRRSALFADSEAGVMCSATHAGLRVRLSKAEVVERVGRRSDMGPGKPYWKRPFGFTGGRISLSGCAGVAGIGRGEEIVFVGAAGVVEFGTEKASRCFRAEKRAAVAPAPAAADTPAMIANVVLDILTNRGRKAARPCRCSRQAQEVFK